MFEISQSYSQSGFMCMMFHRRDTHVIEIQTGQQASRLEDACAPDHFDVNKNPYITLLGKWEGGVSLESVAQIFNQIFVVLPDNSQ